MKTVDHLLYKRHQSQILIVLYLIVVQDFPKKKNMIRSVFGIDLGIENIAVDSDRVSQ